MFSAFTPLAGGNFTSRTWAPAPIDTTAELNFTRQPQARGIDPYPSMIGATNGLLHLFDAAEYSIMLGANPNGPYQGVVPDYSSIFPNLQGGLAKVTG